MTRITIYTDLDGTLLDHDDYSHAPADALLEELEQQRIPVIPATSKTRAELLQLRAELGNSHPFIVENGAAVFIPCGYFQQQPEDTGERDGFWVKEFVQPRRHWLELLMKAERLCPVRYKRFSNLDAGQLAALTGLSVEQAELAGQREYGEPLHWMGDAKEQATFIETLNSLGAQVLQGGRFLHVSGISDKGRALRWLNRQFDANGSATEPVSVALGDSPNDLAMLEAAEYAIVVRSPAHPPLSLKRRQNTYVTEKPGPAGWDEGIRRLLQQMK